MDCWNMSNGDPWGSAVKTGLERAWRFSSETRDVIEYGQPGGCPAEGTTYNGPLINHPTLITRENPKGKSCTTPNAEITYCVENITSNYSHIFFEMTTYKCKVSTF